MKKVLVSILLVSSVVGVLPLHGMIRAPRVGAPARVRVTAPHRPIARSSHFQAHFQADKARLEKEQVERYRFKNLMDQCEVTNQICDAKVAAGKNDLSFVRWSRLLGASVVANTLMAGFFMYFSSLEFASLEVVGVPALGVVFGYSCYRNRKAERVVEQRTMQQLEEKKVTLARLEGKLEGQLEAAIRKQAELQTVKEKNGLQ